MPSYRVTIDTIVEGALHPPDAAGEMASWLTDHTFVSTYWVEDLDTGETFLVDTETIDWNEVYGTDPEG